MKQDVRASRRCAGILRKMWKSAALCPLFPAVSVFLAGSVPSALAQTTATVTAASQQAVLSPAAFGANTAVWDRRLLDPEVAPLLRAGVTALRFPGGSTADEYHWQTRSGGANSAITFDKLMRLAQAVGAAPSGHSCEGPVWTPLRSSCRASLAGDYCSFPVVPALKSGEAIRQAHFLKKSAL